MATFDPTIITLDLSEVTPADAVVEIIGEEAKVCTVQLAENCRECVYTLDCPISLAVGERRRV